MVVVTNTVTIAKTLSILVPHNAKNLLASLRRLVPTI